MKGLCHENNFKKAKGILIHPSIKDSTKTNKQVLRLMFRHTYYIFWQLDKYLILMIVMKKRVKVQILVHQTKETYKKRCFY